MSVAAAPAASLLTSAARPSLWREATRRFRRHRLAMVGFTVLLVMVAGVLAGPFVYRVPIDRTCSPGCSTVAASRSPSAWWPC